MLKIHKLQKESHMLGNNFLFLKVYKSFYFSNAFEFLPYQQLNSINTTHRQHNHNQTTQH